MINEKGAIGALKNVDQRKDSVMPFNTTSGVAQFISEQIAKSDRAIDDIALDAGMKPRLLRMITAGTAKLAVNQAGDLAKAIKVDGIYLLRLLLEDYLPESWSIIQDKLA